MRALVSESERAVVSMTTPATLHVVSALLDDSLVFIHHHQVMVQVMTKPARIKSTVVAVKEYERDVAMGLAHEVRESSNGARVPNHRSHRIEFMVRSAIVVRVATRPAVHEIVMTHESSLTSICQRPVMSSSASSTRW